MAPKEYSKYQQDLIRRYYQELDSIMLQKLSELVTELYLAESRAKRRKLWARTHKALVKLKIPPAVIKHIMEKQDVEVLAKNLNDWLKESKK